MIKCSWSYPMVNSFSLQQSYNLLEKFPCVYIESKDPNHNGNNLLCYFNGMIEHNNEIETGCYEYFINSNGTLFHRMFRPWSLLPNNVKKMLKN